MCRFDLTKGGKFNLTKENQGLNEIEVKLIWKGPDIDASTFLLGKDGIITNDYDFVFYNSNNREHAFQVYQDKVKEDGRWSVDHKERKKATRKTWMEDIRPMSSDGSLLGAFDDLGGDDDSGDESYETINVTLDAVKDEIREIVFVVTVYNQPGTPASKQVTFGQIVNPCISVVNTETGDEILRYQIDEKFKNETGVEVARLYRTDDEEWAFEAVGEGFDGGLQYFVEVYT